MTSTGASRIGFHALAQFAYCPQRWAYANVLGLEPLVLPRGRTVGTVLHTHLAAWYEGLDVEACLGRVSELPTSMGFAFEEAAELFEAYRARYPRGTEPFEVLAVETEYEVGLREFTFTRRLDLVVKGRDGLVWVYDHKTAARPSERMAGADSDWSLLTQELIGRHVVAPQHNLPFGGVVLNVIGTQKRAEQGYDAFFRQPLRFPGRMVEAAPRTLHRLLTWRQELMGSNPWEYPRTGAVTSGCVERYGVCDFKALCLYGRAALGQYTRG